MPIEIDWDDIDEGIDSTFKQTQNPSDPVWEEDPVDFVTFMTDPYHLGQPKPTRIQKRDVEKLLGKDPKKIFSGGSDVNVFIGMWGKGSGKDWLCAIIQTYIIYVLLCMKNPAMYFGLADREFLDCLNVSESKHHAETVYYEKFMDKISHWPWLAERYTILDSKGRLFPAKGNEKGKQEVRLTTGGIEFLDKKIRAISKGADAEKSEGMAPIFWLMDEASAFKDHTETMNGDKIYKTLRTSSKSRFGLRWKGAIISWPREENDFTMRMYNLAIKSGVDSTDVEDGQRVAMYASKHMTWEVRPEGSFSKETFELNGINIPMTFYEEFMTDPEDSFCKFCCIPPAVESAFFSFRDRITECINVDKKPVVLFEDVEVIHTQKDTGASQRYVGKRVQEYLDKTMEMRKTPHVIHVDGGLKKDNAALIMAHGEPIEIIVRDEETGVTTPTFRYKVVVDLAAIWKPNKQKKLQVSFNNIEAIIIELSKTYRLVKVSYDQWNSQSSLEMLQSMNIAAEEHTIRDNDYRELRTMVYQRAVEMLPPTYSYGNDDGVKFYENEAASLLIHELTRLKNLNNRVDHPKDGSKDLADCLAGVNRLLNDPKQILKTRRTMPRSTMGRAFVRSSQMPFSPAQAGITTEIPSMPGLPRTSTPQTGMTGPGYARYSGANDGAIPMPGQVGTNVRRLPRTILSGGASTTSQYLQGLGRQDVPGHFLR